VGGWVFTFWLRHLLALLDEGGARRSPDHPDEATQEAAAHLVGRVGMNRDALRLGVRQVRPGVQRRGEQDEEAAAAQGTEGRPETVRVEAAVGVVDECVDLAAEQSATIRDAESTSCRAALGKPMRRLARTAYQSGLRDGQGPATVAGDDECPALIRGGCLRAKRQREAVEGCAIRRREGFADLRPVGPR